MMECKNCPKMEWVHEENCNYLKCMATKSKRGKTLDWHMDTYQFIGGKFIPDKPEIIDEYKPEIINEYFETRLNRRSTPKWCPLKNTQTK